MKAFVFFILPSRDLDVPKRAYFDLSECAKMEVEDAELLFTKALKLLLASSTR